ncbi:MAG: restriction endonuclease subunit S [Candidatus Pacebacteria bacterium]|nr:restriction endonuclease subunit S [Candidatus Paceibacterota bacterium]
MKTNWQTKKLGDILDIERGGSPRPINSFLTDNKNGINWIKIGDTKNVNKYIESTRQKIKPEGLKKSRLVKEGDFILSNSMSFGKPYIMKTTGAIHDGWLVLRPKSNNIDQDFLYLILGSPLVFKQFDNLAAGSTVRNLNIGLVKSVQIPLPPLSEQKRIVKILDGVFGKIETAKKNAEKNLQNSKELFESYLQGVFADCEDWEEDKLGSLTLKIGSGATPRGGKKSYKKEGISLVRSMNVHDRNFVEKNLAFINDIQAEKLSNVTLKKGDVLLNITGASVTRCCVFPEKYLPARVNQHVSIIRLKQESVDCNFLNYLLTSKYYKDQLLEIGEQGATRQAITKAQLEDFTISFPKSLSEQKQIVKKLDALSKQTKKLEKNYQQKIDDLDELKKSVLQKAFNGEL